MTFDKEYFQQIFRIIMVTNLAPILANLYLAMFNVTGGAKKEMYTRLETKMAKMFFEIHRRWFWYYGGYKKGCPILDKPVQWFKKNNKNR